MKKLILVIFFFMITSLIFSESNEITKEYLISNQWDDLTFYKDNTVSNTGQFGGDIDGTYSIQNNILTIVFTSGNHYYLEKIKNKEIKYKLVHDYSEIYPDKLMTSDVDKHFQTFLNTSVRQKEGAIIQISPELQLYILNPREATATTNIKIRDFPSLSSNTYYFEHGMALPNYPIHYLKKGRKVIIQGRTTTKIKINNNENYWYVVEIIFDDEYESIKLSTKEKPLTKFIWIYGEFIKF